MVDATPIEKNPAVQPATVTKQRKYQAGKATVSTDETIPCDVGTITAAGHGVFKASDGSACTHTVATTIITVTETLTDEDVYFFAIGAV